MVEELELMKLKSKQRYICMFRRAVALLLRSMRQPVAAIAGYMGMSSVSISKMIAKYNDDRDDKLYNIAAKSVEDNKYMIYEDYKKYKREWDGKHGKR